jgi:hypothetical protein
VGPGIGNTTAAGTEGDRLAGTTYIQRIATPAASLLQRPSATRTRQAPRPRFPYTAEYYFWKAIGE